MHISYHQPSVPLAQDSFLLYKPAFPLPLLLVPYVDSLYYHITSRKSTLPHNILLTVSLSNIE
jgi:hypothetical protein